MRAYTAALPNKATQAIIDQIFPDMRFMLSPACLKSFGRSREWLLYDRGYALDNGAFSYYKRGLDFDGGAFLAMCDKYADRSDWIVIPDKVGDWQETVKMCMRWTNILISYERPLMLVAQDGCEVNNYEVIRSAMSSSIYGGIFVGGSTDWKLQHMQALATICTEKSKICHVGRVNSRRRILQCHEAGAHSFDGSGSSRFNPTALIVCKTMRDLDRQYKLF